MRPCQGSAGLIQMYSRPSPQRPTTEERKGTLGQRFTGSVSLGRIGSPANQFLTVVKAEKLNFDVDYFIMIYIRMNVACGKRTAGMTLRAGP